ncbi:hypothetical protein [Streptomyces sp. NPDC014006]|uniref:hypothetical protein n=1 Tax=Streptomyces sp. NPDC014006 TaxID=3364870 RepID=UPI0036F93FD6
MNVLVNVAPARPALAVSTPLLVVMALCRSFEMHREPVAKRIVAAVVLADDPVGGEVGDQVCPFALGRVSEVDLEWKK